MSNEIVNPARPIVRSIFMYRIIDGHKVRWRFEVDSEMVIIRESPVETGVKPLPYVGITASELPDALPAPAAPTQPPSAPVSPEEMQKKAIAAYKQTLDDRGITYTVNEHGQILINNVPNIERDIMQFFDLRQPCPASPGFAQIREHYIEEYNRLGGAACPGCTLNTLQRKYRDRLKSISNIPT